MKNAGLFVFGTFENVKLSMVEIGKLKQQFGEDGASERIEALSVYLAAKGRKYKSHYAVILMWERMHKPAPVLQKKDKTALQYDADEQRAWAARVEREAAADLKRMREEDQRRHK